MLKPRCDCDSDEGLGGETEEPEPRSVLSERTSGVLSDCSVSCRAPSPLSCSQSQGSPDEQPPAPQRGGSDPNLCLARPAGATEGPWGGDDSASSLDSSSTVASSTGTVTECPADSPTQRPRSWPDGAESSTEGDGAGGGGWWEEGEGVPLLEETDEYGRYFSATLGVDTQSKENCEYPGHTGSGHTGGGDTG